MAEKYDPSKPWKIDVDILRSSQYEGLSEGLLYLDEQDRLWLPVNISFDATQSTDAWRAVQTNLLLTSEDRGLTWEHTDRPWPGPDHRRTTLSDGTILEMGTSGWFRYPRSEVARLEAEGYFVWDLGPQHNYCAIIYDLFQKRSTDGGRTWEKRQIEAQLPFFAHFVARGPLRLLDDGSLVFLAYGYDRENRKPCRNEGLLSGYTWGRSSVYCVRSTDGGETWDLVQMADGRHSPTDQGFTETFPIIHSDGDMFVMLRTELGTHAYSVSSSDGGRTWTQPARTPILAKHPLPTALRDGTVVCSYQRRFAQPFGVRARFTSDRGQTWSEETVLRDDIPISDGLTGPNSVEFSDGTLFTSFGAKKYDDQGREWPFVGGCHWTRSYRRPYGPLLDVPPPGEKYNSRGER